MSNIRYVAYIDEAGDFGLRGIAPFDEGGASEWFVLAAALIRKEHVSASEEWMLDLRRAAQVLKEPSLHYHKVPHSKKEIICRAAAEPLIRYFVVASNKLNMKSHRNRHAENISGHRHWFYWWIARLLLERVTEYCARRNAREGTPDGQLQIEFSRRRDLRYWQFKDYFTRLWLQRNSKSLYLAKREIEWSVFDSRNVFFYDHESSAGMQFADIAASAFYQSLNTRNSGADQSKFAISLEPRMGRSPTGIIRDEGFTVWPLRLRSAGLVESQKKVLRFYGYSDREL